MAQDDREGYWECIEVRHQTYDYNEPDKDYWSNSKSGSAGTGTFTSTYVGPDEKDDYAPDRKTAKAQWCRAVFRHRRSTLTAGKQ